MISNQLTIFLSLICLVLVSHSWYVHSKVKDGLARLMLLWGCGFLLFYLLFRIVNLSLLELGWINLSESKEWANYNVFMIYGIVIGQWYIQRHGVERQEDKDLQSDKKELKSRRSNK